MDHVEQPKLCAACLAQVHTLALMGPPNDSIVKRCDCAGENATVIAVAAKRGGIIRHFHLEGPMSAEQADVVGAAVFAQFAQSGAVVHELRRQ